MVTIKLTSQQRTALADLLDATITDLGTEIAHTDRHDFRVALKLRRQQYRDLLDQLQSQPHHVG